MSNDKPIRVLYVDDDIPLARLLIQAVEAAGYIVDHAPDGQKGLALLEQIPYDVLLVDHLMPVYSGLDVLRAVASRGPMPPTIMITGAGNETVAVEAMKLGATDYIVKDLDCSFLEVLPTVIERALAQKRLLDEKRRAEAALQESEERYRRLFENAPVGIFLFDTSGRILSANPACLHIWGLDTTQTDSELNVFTSPEIVARGWTSRCQECLTGGIVSRAEDPITLASGERICDRVYLVPIRDESGTIVGGQGIIEDMTDRQKAAELLLQMERLQAVAELARGVAHNFNNLLQVIIAGAEIALSDITEGNLERVRLTLRQLIESSCAGAEMVKRLGRFAQMQAGLPGVSENTCDLSLIVRQVFDTYETEWKALAGAEGRCFEVTTSLVPCCVVRGNPDEWFEVVASLSKNAVDAIRQDGKIHVATSRDQSEVYLTVSDNGVGIPPQLLGRVFEPFFTTKGYQRAGMGLPSSYGIVKRYGGNITVESLPGQGAVFRVRVPLARETSSSQESSIAPPPTHDAHCAAY